MQFIPQPTDNQITRELEHALLWNACLSPASIDFETRNGVVMLSGKVDDEIKKWAAREAAYNVPGVQDVIDTIVVRPTLKRTDKDILHDVEQVLKNDRRVQFGKVCLEVDEGVVKLTGKADSLFQKMAADEAARWVNGVKSVENKMEIELSQKEIDDQVSAELYRLLSENTLLQNCEIEVKVKNTAIALEGEVQTEKQKMLAEALASTIVTASYVTNRMVTVDESKN